MAKDYWTCPYCGANLDHGENCDCMDEKREATPVQREQPLTHHQDNTTKKSVMSTENGGNAMENTGQENHELIAVRQVPVIEENLREMRQTVEARVKDALAMACTEENYKAVKKVRSDLRKEHADLETRRKAVKAAILAPYDKFEGAYKENVGDLYTDADKKLKARIDEVEDGLRKQKAAEVRVHFDQCRVTFGIAPDLVSFEQSGIKVTLSASTETLKARATEYLSRIAGDLELIEAQEYRDEVMAEYRQTLDVSKAVKTVRERHQAAEQERQRREAEAEAERKASSPAAEFPEEEERTAETAALPEQAEPFQPEEVVPFASAPVSDVPPFVMDETTVPFAQDAAVPFGVADFPENNSPAALCATDRKTYILRITANDEEMDKLRGFLASVGCRFAIIE